MTIEERVRQEHPDWTDEQVAAEVARLEQQNPPAPPAPGGDQDRAFAEMRRRAEAAERDAQAARDQLAERERQEAEQQGEYKRLYEEQKAENETLKATQARAEQRRHAERTAGDLKFRDTGYALYLLDQQRVDMSDAAAVKAALDQLVADRPDLVGTAPPPPPSGGPAGGGNQDPPKLTREQLAAMTPDQIRRLDPEVVNAALAG